MTYTNKMPAFTLPRYEAEDPALHWIEEDNYPHNDTNRIIGAFLRGLEKSRDQSDQNNNILEVAEEIRNDEHAPLVAALDNMHMGHFQHFPEHNSEGDEWDDKALEEIANTYIAQSFRDGDIERRGTKDFFEWEKPLPWEGKPVEWQARLVILARALNTETLEHMKYDAQGRYLDPTDWDKIDREEEAREEEEEAEEASTSSALSREEDDEQKEARETAEAEAETEANSN